LSPPTPNGQWGNPGHVGDAIKRWVKTTVLVFGLAIGCCQQSPGADLSYRAMGPIDQRKMAIPQVLPFYRMATPSFWPTHERDAGGFSLLSEPRSALFSGPAFVQKTIGFVFVRRTGLAVWGSNTFVQQSEWH